MYHFLRSTFSLRTLIPALALIPYVIGRASAVGPMKAREHRGSMITKGVLEREPLVSTEQTLFGSEVY